MSSMTNPQTITTRVAGHAITATYVEDEWEIIIDASLGWAQSPYPLRSIYVSTDVVGPLTAAMSAVMDYEATRSPYTGHTPDCTAQDTLDESDCDC